MQLGTQILDAEARCSVEAVALTSVSEAAPSKEEMLGTLLEALRCATRKMVVGSMAQMGALFIHVHLIQHENIRSWLLTTLVEEGETCIGADKDDTFTQARDCARRMKAEFTSTPKTRVMQSLWRDGVTPTALEMVVVAAAFHLNPQDYRNTDAFLNQAGLFLVRLADMASQHPETQAGDRRLMRSVSLA